MESKNIYQKLHEARKYIKTCDAKKEGENKHFHFAYFTPEQVSLLVHQASENQNIIPLFNLKKNEYGHYGILIIQDLDLDQQIVFEMSTAVPDIKAATITQQLGGAVTYTERYLLMTAFDIKDNNLDPDNTMTKADETPQPEKWLNKWTDREKTSEDSTYWKIVENARENSKGIDDLRKVFKISKEIATELETDLK